MENNLFDFIDKSIVLSLKENDLIVFTIKPELELEDIEYFRLKEYISKFLDENNIKNKFVILEGVEVNILRKED